MQLCTRVVVLQVEDRRDGMKEEKKRMNRNKDIRLEGKIEGRKEYRYGDGAGGSLQPINASTI